MKIKVKRTFLYDEFEQATILWALDNVALIKHEDLILEEPDSNRAKASVLAGKIRQASKNSP